MATEDLRFERTNEELKDNSRELLLRSRERMRQLDDMLRTVHKHFGVSYEEKPPMGFSTG